MTFGEAWKAMEQGKKVCIPRYKDSVIYLKDNHINYNKVSTVISNKYANVSKKIKDKHADYIASFEDKEAPTTLLHMYNDSCGEKNRFADFKSNYDLFKRPPFDMDSMYLGHIYPFYRVFQL